MFPTHIFKAYDIRGLVQGELSEDLAYKIGRAFVVFLRKKGENLQEKSIVVGRDMRESSPFLAEQVIKGIQDEGVGVVDIGLVSTPLFNFACANYDEHAGGIMVTASHNPAKYNGFKMSLSNALPVGKNSGMDEIRNLVEKNDFQNSESKGSVREKDVFPDYEERVFTIVRPESIRPLKIVIDAGNGMADVTIPKILKHLPVKAEFLFLEPDGRFPNHEANPLKIETLKDLQKRVIDTNADLGFALDGDADRIGLVDEKGDVVDPSFVGALVGLEVLKKNPGAHMLYDLRSSMIVGESWENHGATSEMCMVGHALIKKMMAEKSALFASELSLHLYFADMFNVESSDLALLYVLQMLSQQKKPLSELVRPLKKYFHSGEINFEVENKDEILKSFEDSYKDQAEEVSYIDGIWMKFEWGWISLRASNTEPMLRLNLETRTEEKLEEELSKIRKIINSP